MPPRPHHGVRGPDPEGRLGARSRQASRLPAGVPPPAQGGGGSLGGVLVVVAFGEVTFGISLLLFVLVLMLELVFVL